VGDELLNIGYDASALAAIAKFAQFDAALQIEIAPVMVQVGDLVVQAMIANTWTAFSNPTGALADSISATPKNAMEIDIIVNVPYAWRMEAGFSGADSLGRVYNEQGKPYAMPALTDNQDAIIQIMSTGLANVFARMAGR
jgi:hypothetical protein